MSHEPVDPLARVDLDLLRAQVAAHCERRGITPWAFSLECGGSSWTVAKFLRETKRGLSVNVLASIAYAADLSIDALVVEG